jgi:hypothetical protein
MVQTAMGAVTVKPDLRTVVPWQKYIDAEDEDRDETQELYDEARRFLVKKKWCRGIEDQYAGIIVPGVIGVFLFKIIPARPEVDDWLWVIVGDLPSAYLVCDECPNPATAIDGYIGEMERWVAAAESGRSVADLIPVNVPPTPKYAKMLGSRLKFVEREILSAYKDWL